jgi:DNA adenine methylase
MEPILKAVGGKRWLSAKLAAEIMTLQPETYVEPFVGGGAVTLALPPKLPKVISDTNPGFAQVWAVIKARKPEEVFEGIRAVERRYANTGFGYAQAVKDINQYLGSAPSMFDPLGLSLEALQFAALTLYVNARSFNGLWRVAKKDGCFNVPWGKYKNPRRLSIAEIVLLHRALASVDILNLDFRRVLQLLCGEDFRARRQKIAIYLDPPYDSIPDEQSRKAFVSYTREGFDDQDQRDLADWAKYVAGLGMHVWASNADTPLIRELYSWAKIETVTEFHSVGATGGRRGDRGCLLIRSP